jgi:hypothetical protein
VCGVGGGGGVGVGGDFLTGAFEGGGAGGGGTRPGGDARKSLDGGRQSYNTQHGGD